MGKPPKDTKKRALVLARREDIKNYAVSLCSGEGYDATGCLENEEARKLLDSKTFTVAILGNVFVNEKRFEGELEEMKSLLTAKGIPFAACPTFGDAKGALKSLGLLEEKPQPGNGTMAG